MGFHVARKDRLWLKEVFFLELIVCFFFYRFGVFFFGKRICILGYKVFLGENGVRIEFLDKNNYPARFFNTSTMVTSIVMKPGQALRVNCRPE